MNTLECLSKNGYSDKGAAACYDKWEVWFAVVEQSIPNNFLSSEGDSLDPMVESRTPLQLHNCSKQENDLNLEYD